MTKQWEIRSVTKVKACSDFTLECTFDDTTTGVFDLKPILTKGGEVVAPLRKKAFFKKVFIEMGVPTWPNGFDIDADYLYRSINDSKPTRTRNVRPMGRTR